MLTRESFFKNLRSSLNHLYDPDKLRRSPLLDLFGIANIPDAPTALSRILIQAILSLKPPDETIHNQAWEVYEALFYRYVEQLSPQEVADQLAIGSRQLRRKQYGALLVLANLLWNQYHPDTFTELEKERSLPEKIRKSGGKGIDHELAWLKETAQDQTVNLEEILPAVLKWVGRMASQHNIQIDTQLAGPYSTLIIHPVLLRQVLIILLGFGISRASNGIVYVTAKNIRREVQVRIQCPHSLGAYKPFTESETANLNNAHQLAKISNCRLTLINDVNEYTASLSIPSREEVRVLAIDDNLDTLQMLKRYALGTRYHLVTARNPEQAISIAEKFQPKIILLDVMMPQTDGWQVLEQLRQNPLTANTRIIIFSILGQNDFAYFLGADAYLTKPVTQPAFLSALDQQVE